MGLSFGRISDGRRSVFVSALVISARVKEVGGVAMNGCRLLVGGGTSMRVTAATTVLGRH